MKPSSFLRRALRGGTGPPLRHIIGDPKQRWGQCALVWAARVGCLKKEDLTCFGSGLKFTRTTVAVRTTCCCVVFEESVFEKMRTPNSEDSTVDGEGQCPNPFCPTRTRCPSGDFDASKLHHDHDHHQYPFQVLKSGWKPFLELRSRFEAQMEYCKHWDHLEENKVSGMGIMFLCLCYIGTGTS